MKREEKREERRHAEEGSQGSRVMREEKGEEVIRDMENRNEGRYCSEMLKGDM